MRYLNIILIIIIINACSNLVEKNERARRQITFKFEANNKFIYESDFTVNRIYINDSVFADKGVLCSGVSGICTIKFCVTKKGWKVWTGNSWVALFNAKCQLNSIYLPYTKKTIKPAKSYILGADTLYAFTCRDENANFSTDYNEYLLSKKDGIVIIKNEETFYKRLDYQNADIDSIMN